MVCLSAKPVVDGLEEELGGPTRVRVLRADMRSAAGRALAERYQIDTVPSFLAFAGDGRLLLRLNGTSGVPTAALRRALGSP